MVFGDGAFGRWLQSSEVVRAGPESDGTGVLMDDEEALERVLPARCQYRVEEGPWEDTA